MNDDNDMIEQHAETSDVFSPNQIEHQDESAASVQVSAESIKDQIRAQHLLEIAEDYHQTLLLLSPADMRNPDLTALDSQSEELAALRSEAERRSVGASSVPHPAMWLHNALLDLAAAAEDIRQSSDPDTESLNVLRNSRPGWALPMNAQADPPEPILWDLNDQTPQHPSLILAAGEVAILAGEGGIGKSWLSLQIATAAAANAGMRPSSKVLGFGVKAGPVLMISYEDGQGVIYRRAQILAWREEEETSAPANTVQIPDSAMVSYDPGPLWNGPASFGAASGPGQGWGVLQDMMDAFEPVLLVIDPASVALADAAISETGPVRSFIAALRQIASDKCGVMVVAHSTKEAREAARAGAHTSGMVAGSAAWFDGARGVLTLTGYPDSDPTPRKDETIDEAAARAAAFKGHSMLRVAKASYAEAGQTWHLRPYHLTSRGGRLHAGHEIDAAGQPGGGAGQPGGGRQGPGTAAGGKPGPATDPDTGRDDSRYDGRYDEPF